MRPEPNDFKILIRSTGLWILRIKKKISTTEKRIDCFTELQSLDIAKKNWTLNTKKGKNK